MFTHHHPAARSALGQSSAFNMPFQKDYITTQLAFLTSIYSRWSAIGESSQRGKGSLLPKPEGPEDLVHAGNRAKALLKGEIKWEPTWKTLERAR
jgi:hypothetical protein